MREICEVYDGCSDEESQGIAQCESPGDPCQQMPQLSTDVSMIGNSFYTLPMSEFTVIHSNKVGNLH